MNFENALNALQFKGMFFFLNEIIVSPEWRDEDVTCSNGASATIIINYLAIFLFNQPEFGVHAAGPGVGFFTLDRTPSTHVRPLITGRFRSGQPTNFHFGSLNSLIFSQIEKHFKQGTSTSLHSTVVHLNLSSYLTLT